MVVQWFQNLIDGVVDTLSELRENARRGKQLPAYRAGVEQEDDPLDAADDFVDRFFGGVFDTFEDEVAEPIEDRGDLKPENVENAINEAEGNALQLALGVIGGTLALEIAGGTQLETHEEAIAQIGTFLTLEEVLGRRLGMLYEKGVDPALEARIAKQTRSEFVSLPDAVEYLLRNKTADEGWITGTETRGDARDVIGSNEPVNPENPLEEWGIRDDNLQILETVSLNAPEFEEILETPLQLGVPPTQESIDDAIQLSGLPDSIASVFREAASNATKSADMWEQRTTSGELVPELDTLALDEEVTPAEAVALLPDDLEEPVEFLRDRWRLFQTLPSGAPTRSLIENSGTLGFTSISELEDRLERLEYDTERYSDVVEYTLYNEVDGNLQEAFALGLISEGTYGEVMDRVGLDSEAQGALMSGQSISDVVTARLEEQADPGDLPVSSILGIGESRASGLQAVGIETVADLAVADVQDVEDAAQVEEGTAQGFIDAAALRVS